MRVGTQILRSVVFIGADTGSGFQIGGTAFFVGVPFEEAPEHGHAYLVTARHNVARASELGTICVRVNLRNGGTEIVEVHNGWLMPENPASDVAIRPLEFREEVEVAVVKRSTFVDDRFLEDFGVGPGDDLAIVGLFAEREGATRNLPIVRTGSIAAMPSETMQDEESGEDFRAFLAEVRSIGGLSGSPAYVVLHHGQLFPGGHVIPEGHIKFGLLGIMRGHWDRGAGEQTGSRTTERAILNLGIAMVTPIDEVLALLDSEDLVRERRRVESHSRDQAAPPTSSSPVAPSDADNQQT